ncbi:hypothetical protein ACXC9Q_25365 [Kribbella sp. CWNU-51]
MRLLPRSAYDALGVTLVRGATSRDKVVEVEGEESDIRPRLKQLLG